MELTAPLNLLTVYQISKAIVENYPAQYNDQDDEIQCLRLNTFAVLETAENLGNPKELLKDLDKDNLGKGKRDIGKDFFFSRTFKNNLHDLSKMDFIYPLLGVAEADFSFDLFNMGKQRQMLNFFTVDWIGQSEHACTEGYCAYRTKEEVGADLRKLLGIFLTTLSGFVWAEVEDDLGNLKKEWFSLPYLEHLEQEGEISSFDPIFEMSDYIVTKKPQAEVFYDLFHNKGLVGCLTNIQFDFEGCPPELLIKFPNTSLDYVKSGDCSTC